ncbi:MAG: DUF4126 family protein [Desulfobacterales bacterium]|jgi:hypothetical protein|nr:DUF4126 family protein [Desulfobacterales bacterium]
MEAYQHIIHTLALTMGASWASGLNLYAAIAMLGLSGVYGAIQLPPDLLVLTNPLVIFAACVMYVVEFVADKIPGVDTTWDGLHTFIRIPAGALLAAGAVGTVNPALAIAAGILGGGMATASHATKAGGRVLINASPEPFTNWMASISEDIAVFGGLWVALHHPWIFLGLLVLFLLFAIWLLPRIGRGIKTIFKFIGRLFGMRPADGVPADLPPQEADRLDRLKKLKELLDSGVLSEAEFNREKEKILGTEI